MKRFVLLGALMAGLIAGTTNAADDAWSFSLKPYFWAMGLNGTTRIGELPPAEVDAGFSDIWDNFDSGLALIGVARKGEWMMVGDVSYLDLSISDSVQGVPITADITSTIVMLGGGYQVFADDVTSMDVYGGARFWRAENKISATGVGSASRTEDWTSPLIGMSAKGTFGAKGLWFLMADVGGFGAGSDLEWQIFPGVGYQFTPLISAYASYRWLDVDYEKSDYVYDLLTQGWLTGIGFTF